MTPLDLDRIVAAYRALAHPRRLQLFLEIARSGPAGLAFDALRSRSKRASTLSMHLKALRHASLIFETGKPLHVHANAALHRALVDVLLADVPTVPTPTGERASSTTREPRAPVASPSHARHLSEIPEK